VPAERGAKDERADSASVEDRGDAAPRRHHVRDRAAAAAALFLDSTTDGVLYSNVGTLAKLREAKKIAAETLKETKAAAKDYGYGTARQLKLGLSVAGDTHEYALGA
jgi:hypothetical protein